MMLCCQVLRRAGHPEILDIRIPADNRPYSMTERETYLISDELMTEEALDEFRNPPMLKRVADDELKHELEARGYTVTKKAVTL